MRTVVFGLVGWLLVLTGWAQQAPTVWYPGNGLVFNFQQSPAQVSVSGNVLAQGGALTCTDAQGQVVLTVTQTGFYNRNGQLLLNGLFTPVPNIGSTFYKDGAVLVPAPGAGQRYYLFYVASVPYTSSSPNATGTHVCYCLVDLAANNGDGAVLVKEQELYVDLHGSITVTASCAFEGYWLVGEANRNVREGTDPIFAYKVTAAGVAAQPVISTPIRIGSSSRYKASPAGDRIMFNYIWGSINGVNIDGYMLARFNQATGSVTDVLRIHGPASFAEFSPSGRLLYLCRNDSLYQFDVSVHDQARIVASRKLLRAGLDRYECLQLAPDGRIYLSTWPYVKPVKMAVIPYPERLGAASGLLPFTTPRSIDFLPSLAAFQLYEAPQPVVAGPDVSACPGQQVQVQGVPLPGVASWSPATYLSSTTAATPTFTYTGPTPTDSLKLLYTRTYVEGTCVRREVVYVTVLPPPVATLVGSTSVCPGVAGVEYRVTNPRPGYTYQWSVSGGTLAGGQGTAVALVNWGAANAAAQVTVQASTPGQCAGPPSRLPVRVNVQLQTTTPQGSTRVCLAQGQGVAYSLPATAGSVYTWQARGGRVASGQGTSRITVDWTTPGSNAVWVSEQSTTIDTVCYGTSAPLPVLVVRDTTRAQLTAVSIGPDNASSTLSWTFNQPPTTANAVQVLRRPAGAGASAWQPVAVLPATARSYADQNLQASQTSYDYLLRTTNECREDRESLPHRTVLLQATAPPAGPIRLAWSAYQGWPGGPAAYEVWRRLDAEPNFGRLLQVSGTTLALSDLATTAGFAHYYRIRAVGPGGVGAWSNTADLSFEHPIVIPNVFTPNGDGLNDRFEIPNLATLYPGSRLEVYDRWGRRVYEHAAYGGQWAGDGQPAGIYYYRLLVPQPRQELKGWVEVVR